MGLAEFKIRLLKIVSQRSVEYANNDKAPFQSNVSISKNLHKDALKYSKTKGVHSTQTEDGSKAICYMSKVDSAAEIDISDLETFLHASYESFEEYASNMFNYYTIAFDNGKPEEWLQTASCTCIAFADHFICKHVVAIAYKLKLLKEAKYLDPNKQPGRPKKGTGALTLD